MTDKRNEETGVGTTGHNWDGIEEWNNPMPRWWVWTFYLTIIWGIGYCIAYPAWPLINSATAGLLGYSTRAEVAEQISAVEAQNAELQAALATADLNAIKDQPDLHNYAVQGGAAVFRNNCSQCHGAGAAGVSWIGLVNGSSTRAGGRSSPATFSMLRARATTPSASARRAVALEW